MRIKVLRNLGRDLPPFRENQVVETSEEEGGRLVAKGLAEATDDPVTTEQDLLAVPRGATIGRGKAEPGSVERATQDLKDSKSRAARTQPATPETIAKNPHEAK